MGEYLRLKKSNCKNCYKCIRHCPVKSIRFSDNQASIIDDECVLCGQCFVVCPQGAKEIISEAETAKALLSGGSPVIASVAPSFIANYPGAGIESLRSALMELGFAGAEETAIGATLVKSAYEDLMDQGRDVIISSCCPTVNLLIQKHFPDCLPLLAPVTSPMLAHCSDIKRRIPGAKTVFIGPCLSKKDEAKRYPDVVDCVLTFEELTQWFEEKGVEPLSEAKASDESLARFFPTSGGILKTFVREHSGYDLLSVDGMERCIDTLRDLQSGSVSHCFIEMSACVGSCVGGPVMEKFRNNPLRNYLQIAGYAGRRDFPVKAESSLLQTYAPLKEELPLPGEIEIRAVLKKMGKEKPEDELNCGSCGYETCREKAIAVYQKKADMTMCLPFLKEKAESFSDIIIGNTPNGILVLDEELRVQQINKAALEILNLRASSDVVGDSVVRILEPQDFMEVLRTGRSIRDKRTYLAEYKKYVDGTILYDKNYRILIYIIKDVTEIETQKLQKESIKSQTVEITDKVVEKQMKIVQEIAYLLGETAAETKIALTKLKESLYDE